MPLTARAGRATLVAIALSVAPPSLSAAQEAVPRSGAPVEVDESALRYFARQGDVERLNAEIARLRALYPDWEPPADPLSIAGGGDPREEALWRLYSEGRYAEVRAEIARIQAQEPDWAPPDALQDRMAEAEIRTRLVNASDLGQYETVVRIASEHQDLLTCTDADVLWRVAQALAETGRDSRSKDAYSYMLENCDDPGARLATMQKAMTALRGPMLVDLLRLERRTPAGPGEFEPIRDELARQAVAEGNADATAAVPQGDLARVASLFDQGQRVDDALLLGWYHLKREDVAQAATWFERARGVEDSAIGAQGLALTLIAKGEFGAAEGTMAPWRDDSDSARSIYLAAAANLLSGDPAPVVEEAVLQRIVPEVVAAKDVGTARQLGWYARAYKQQETAKQWFAAALAWDPGDEAAAYGLVLTLADLGDASGLKSLKAGWDARSERIAAVATPVPLVSGAARGSGDSVPRITDCSGNVSPTRLAAGTALARGWCLLDSNRAIDAAQAFAVALRSSSAKIRSDAAYGQSLAFIRAGLVDQAAVAATQAEQSSTRSNELMASILSERATAAFNRGRYRETLQILDQRAGLAAEQVGLMVIRGYALYNLRRYWQAEEIFEAAARAGNPDAAKGLKLAQTAKRKGL
jgi:cellulose synthase operon protein C